MRVAVVHNAVTDDSAPDERDVLVQTESVRDALGHLAHEAFTVPCSLDLDRVKDRLEQIRPDIVFNLVESLGGQGRLAHLFPALLDTMALPYTGSPTLTLLVTTHKIMAKERLAISGLANTGLDRPLSAGTVVSGTCRVAAPGAGGNRSLDCQIRLGACLFRYGRRRPVGERR